MPITFSVNSKKVTCFNRIIDVDLYYYSKKDRQNKVVSIVTPSYGLKPDITVNLSVLPSNNVIGMTVTIRNVLTDIDISKAYYMSVVMGYDSCGFAIYNCVVFRSYQATPNPDGEFVFEGIVTGEKVEYSDCPSIVENDPVTVKWNDLGNISIKNYIEYILNGNGKRKPKFLFNIDYQVEQKVLNRMSISTININKQHKSFATPISRAVYARQVITEWGKNQDINLVVVIEGSNFIIKSMAKDDAISPDTAIDIIGYKSASFNGALLNITLPYYPAINAGSLIRCDASYATQSGPPNDNNNSIQRNNAWSLYRVMKYSVSFSTVRENTMSIDAFPIKEAGKVDASEEFLPYNKIYNRKNYIQRVLDNEYNTKDNEGKIIVGDTKVDINVVNAKKNNSASSFSSRVFEPYNNLKNVSGVITLLKDLYYGYHVKLEYQEGSGLSSKYFSVDCLFPVVYSLTWYKRKSDSTAADSPDEFPLSFTSGNIFFPTVASLEMNTVAIKSILSDFVKIYEAHNDNSVYNDYIEAWKKMMAYNVAQIRLVRTI